MSFTANFNAALKETGWAGSNNIELAKKLGMSPANVGFIKSGKTKQPMDKTIAKIAKGLGIPVDRLTLGDGSVAFIAKGTKQKAKAKARPKPKAKAKATGSGRKLAKEIDREIAQEKPAPPPPPKPTPAAIYALPNGAAESIAHHLAQELSLTAPHKIAHQMATELLQAAPAAPWVMVTSSLLDRIVRLERAIDDLVASKIA